MTRKRIWFLTMILAMIIAGLFLYRYVSANTFFQGIAISREADAVDLRETDLSISDYETLHAQLPNCSILWSVPFQGSTYPSDSTTLQIHRLSEEDMEILNYFPNLTHLDAAGCTDYPLLLAFQAAHPSCTVTYQVQLGDVLFDRDATIAILEDPDIEELKEKLNYLPELMWLRLSGDLPPVRQLTELRQMFPNIDIQWSVPFEGRSLSTTEPILDLTGSNLDYASAVELLQWLPDAKKVDMRGCGLTDEEMMALADTYPNCFFIWEMTIDDRLFSTDITELDVSGYVMESTEQIEALLPYFRNVERVIMSHCGIDDETMDALNKRYEDIRFVWSVKIHNVYLRTDATYFYPYKFYRSMYVTNDHLYPLRYCTDIVAIDIGHMGEVTDCEWAAFMPNLKYLVIAETSISDLTPLSGLKNLVFLEIFRTKVTDYTPLLSCTSLEDLNMSYTFGDYAPIAQMTWLKTLYWNGIYYTNGLPCTGAGPILEEALPNTKVVYKLHNAARWIGWRDVPNYFAMRDAMDIFYVR